MSETTNTPACRDCRHGFKLNEGAVECRRYPPRHGLEVTARNIGTLENIWPLLSVDHWCGEFAARPVPCAHDFWRYSATEFACKKCGIIVPEDEGSRALREKFTCTVCGFVHSDGGLCVPAVVRERPEGDAP